jgi:CMP-N-acetylneuraminic acid synthetase
MAVVALVPARSGSKGIPGKNTKPLCGKPLIAYTAEAIQASGIFDCSLLSTDSEHIATTARSFGLDAPFLRPEELARDDTPMLAVVEHALDWLDQQGVATELMALLQPTQPLRRPADIIRAIEILRTSNCNSVVSVVPVPLHLSPDYVMRIDDKGQLVNFLPEGSLVSRRQDVRSAYVRDGTIYAFRADTVRKYRSLYGPVCLPVIIDAKNSISIDTPADWEEAERRLGRPAADV